MGMHKWFYRIFKPEVYHKHLYYRKSQWMSRSELKAYQLKRLQEILAYAYHHVPFYQELWDKHQIDYKISSLKELQKFPVIDKVMLQNAVKNGQISKEYIDKLDSSEISWEQTTGSSGEPFRFPLDSSSDNEINGLRRRLYDWYGYDYGVKWVNFWRGNYHKSFKEICKEKLLNQYALCIYDPKYPKETELNDARIAYFIDQLNKIKPKVLEGFVSTLVEIANYMISNNTSLKSPVKSVVTGAELLSEENRLILEKAFGAQVYNRYGGTEGSILAHECQQQSISDHKLHIQEDRVIVETLKDGESVQDQSGEVVFTDLTSKALPFIRYKNGDIAKINSSYKCTCQRVFKLIDEVQGRVNDMFILPNGNKITSHLWQNYMKQTDGIKNYQMIQEARDFVVVNWVKNEALYDEEKFMKVQKLVAGALHECQVEWHEVEKIDVSVGGKYRQHICKVKV